MSLTYDLWCPTLGHNFTRQKKISTQQIACKICDSKIEDTLTANIETLSDVQLEVKKTIRELFLLNHRRNRQRALEKKHAF